MNEKLNGLFADKLNIRATISTLQKLHGDASYRIYYRATLNDGSTYIIMQMPEGKSSASEEITNFSGRPGELPFINVANFLSSCGLPTPKIHHYCPENRLMILEDLGDDLLFNHVDGTDFNAHLKWYRRAIELLIELQNRTAANTDFDCIAKKRSFDATLLNWEFDHFLEYGINARLGSPMSREDTNIFIEESRTISDEITEFRYGFTHRDFQSRNLIVRNDELSLIDFQDALQGPAAYDLVALLRDSYIGLADRTHDELVRYYCDRSGREAMELRYEYDLITVQRKLKDAGRFVYIDQVKGNPNYLKFIPQSLGYVKNALSRMSNHAALLNVIVKYSPELR